MWGAPVPNGEDAPVPIKEGCGLYPTMRSAPVPNNEGCDLYLIMRDGVCTQ